MSKTVIKVENVGKLYRLGEVGTGTMSQDIKRWWAKTRGKEDPFKVVGEVNDRTVKGESDYVWALKDVSFDVKEGEVLGIIGRNGAGKSTLLKILSKVTVPTTGALKVRGRIASLLEVGTGFHPDLTGRENVFLNGAILGMTKKEITKKFDEIVEFASIERYIDTPVKRYSSGMYVRLAFAVAAHLESEILIIDEVLAVGDAEFQKKCIGKMDAVSRGGRTVLFVSHSTGTLAQLCETCVWLGNGTMIKKGPTNIIIEDYLGSQSRSQNFYVADVNKVGKKDAYFAYQRLVNDKGEIINEVANDQTIILEIGLCVNEWQDQMELSISLQHRIKARIFTVNIPLREIMQPNEKEKIIRFSIPGNVITPNPYSWLNSIFIPGLKLIDVLWDECPFKIIDIGSEFARYDGLDYGVVILDKYKVEAV